MGHTDRIDAMSESERSELRSERKQRYPEPNSSGTEGKMEIVHASEPLLSRYSNGFSGRNSPASHHASRGNSVSHEEGSDLHLNLSHKVSAFPQETFGSRPLFERSGISERSASAEKIINLGRNLMKLPTSRANEVLQGIEKISKEEIDGDISSSESLFAIGRVNGALDALEFLFRDAKAMSACVGVGLDNSTVMLTEDLQIHIVRGSTQEPWKKALCDGDAHIIMRVPKYHLNKTSQVLKGDAASKTWGIGFNDPFVSSTNSSEFKVDSQQTNLPILYYLAKYALDNLPILKPILDKITYVVNNHQELIHVLHNGGTSRDQQDKDIFTHGHKQVKSGNKDKYGDKDEGNHEGKDKDGVEDDGNDAGGRNIHDNTIQHKNASLNITSYPGDGGYLDPNVDGFENIHIQPIFKVEFQSKGGIMTITFHFDTKFDIPRSTIEDQNASRFGWYHDCIDLSLTSSKATLIGTGDILNEKVPVTYKIGAPTTHSEYSTSSQDTVQARPETKAKGSFPISTHAYLNHAASVSNASVFGREMKEYHVCDGFRYRNCSNQNLNFNLEFPFDLYDPTDPLIHNTLVTTGSFNTIEPKVKGSWHPQSEEEDSLYVFTACQKLGRRQVDHPSNVESETMQVYKLPIYINHAMTHLH